MHTQETGYEKVDKLYREQMEKVIRLEREIRDIKTRLQDEGIVHTKYISMERRLRLVENEHKCEMYIARGMSLAREELKKVINNR